MRGIFVGIIVLILVVILGFSTYIYTENLNAQRNIKIASLLATPEYQHCLYDESTCPQIESFQLPNYSPFIILVIVILLGVYLVRGDYLQQQILKELQKSEKKDSDKAILKLLLSVLKEDEIKVVLAIKEQPGITQNTLRLRTDFSKAKLSMLLKELENRKLIKKELDKKTNKLYLARKL